MTREERHALLGPEIVAHIHKVVDAAPDPSPELVAELRRIMTRPAGNRRPAARPARAAA
ncbi:hypothetical protein OG352_05950 [Streptomyces sp. NBC_01485]|uniref:hypothetical protein n=1 Tax=Streptomyces sp. NBC_01485 TaxID=2903884 RepID=UPI002E371310|nr:hypothetical protein [Streptomyces sp. NBC_01485]